MNHRPSTEKRAILDGLLALFQQHRRWLLFFGTGTSCALDTNFGMPALQSHLGTALADEPAWKAVDAALKAGQTLEQALDNTGAGLSLETKTKFRKATGDFVAGVDLRHRDALLTGRSQWVGSRLLRTLVGQLPPRNPRLSVLTPNYDMLIEYACSAHGIRFTTGFVGGLKRTWDWDAAQDALLQSRLGRDGPRSTMQSSPLPRVELLKVHGSINRFTEAGRQVECDLWTKSPPDGVERDIAVPGGQKYEQYAVNNMGTASRADHAQDEAQAYAMIGYGFNDPHLHGKIMERVRRNRCPLVVLTLDLEDAMVLKLCRDGAPVWVLTAPRRDGAGFDCASTRVWMPGHGGPMILENERLWNCDFFAERILGA